MLGRKSIVLALVLVLSLGTVTFAQPITFWLMPNAPDAIHVPWLDKHIAIFKEETGIDVKYEIIGWDAAWSRISVALLTGEGVDVFQAGTTWNPQFAATGGVAEIDINEFGGGIVHESQPRLDDLQGKYYGVPWFAETRALFYNKDMFAEAGVEPPNTYDELVEVGKKIVEVFGEGSAIAIAGTNAWDLIHNWAIILWAFGGDLLSPDNKQAVFNEQPGVEA